MPLPEVNERDSAARARVIEDKQARPFTSSFTSRLFSLRLSGWLDVWMAGLCVAVLTMVFFTSKNRDGSTAVYVADANYYYAYLPSLVFDHDLDFTNEYRSTGNWYFLPASPTGVPSNVFGIGPAVFALPFFLLGMLLSKLVGVAPTGFGLYEIRATMFASAVFTALAAWPVASLIRRHFGGRVWPWLIATATLAGTSAAYYAVRQPGFAHPFAMFWTAVLVNHCDKGAGDQREPSTSWWIAAGALLGAATLARPQCVSWGIFLIPPAWRALRSAVALRKLALHLALAALAFVIVFSPQLYAWKSLYGGWLSIPQGPEFMRWDAPLVGPVLFSSRNGLFAFTPLVVLCVAGFVMFSRRRWPIMAWLLVGVSLQALVNAAVWDWWAGGAFGGRRFDSCYVAFSFGLAGLFQAPKALAAALQRRAQQTRFQSRVRLWRGIRLGSTGLLALYVVVLVIGNILLTAKTSASNLLSEGGKPLYQDVQKRIPGPWNYFVAGLSKVATDPARLAFALTYGASRFAYDWVVGKHFLGDLYPGLNSRPPARDQLVTLHPHQLFLVGAAKGALPVVAEKDRLRLLLPINRKYGPLTVRLDLNAPATPNQMNMQWNGTPVSWVPTGNSVTFVAPQFERGTNALDIHMTSAARFQFLSFFLFVPDDGRP